MIVGLFAFFLKGCFWLGKSVIGFFYGRKAAVSKLSDYATLDMSVSNMRPLSDIFAETNGWSESKKIDFCRLACLTWIAHNVVEWMSNVVLEPSFRLTLDQILGQNMAAGFKEQFLISRALLSSNLPLIGWVLFQFLLFFELSMQMPSDIGVLNVLFLYSIKIALVIRMYLNTSEFVMNLLRYGCCCWLLHRLRQRHHAQIRKGGEQLDAIFEQVGAPVILALHLCEMQEVLYVCWPDKGRTEAIGKQVRADTELLQTKNLCRSELDSLRIFALFHVVAACLCKTAK